MEYLYGEDKTFIEQKYHPLDGTFQPYNRFSAAGYACDAGTGLTNTEIAEKITALMEETDGMPHSLVKAKGFALVLDHMRIEVNEHDYFVCMGGYARLLQPLLSKWNREVFSEPFGDEEMRNAYIRSGTASLWLDTDHFVPNWLYIMEKGIPGILETVRTYREKQEQKMPLTPEQTAFYESIITEYEAMLRLILRLRTYALAHPGKKANQIARCMEHLAAGAPQDTFDALQLMYIYFICSEAIEQFQARSLGNGLDRTLQRFYDRDLAEGRYTREEIKTYLAYFLFQYAAMGHPNGHPFYLGGTEPDGSTRFTDLTYDILEVYESLNLYTPKIQVKINTNTPPECIERVCEIIRSGKSSFVFCCQPGMIRSLMGTYGTTYEEALDCDISGCNEMHVRANEACMISALPNAAKAITYAVFNGMDHVTGRQVGLKTGEFTSFRCFDDFYEAFRKQLAYIVDNIIATSVCREALVGELNPSVLISGTIERSLETMQDAYSVGVKYPNSAILLCSFATAVDSLMAVKELVFDKKLVSAAELYTALEHNWEGYEDLQQTALRAQHKFGRGDAEADQYAAAVFQWFSLYTAGRKNSRGGVYKVGIPSTLEYLSQGRLTEATPDGRKMGEELSKNTQPVNGMESAGVTGYLRSVKKLQPWLFSEAFVADVMLHPSAVSGNDGLRAMRGLIETYMKNDGISIQFNIFSYEQLRDAQKHPEKYQNLQVRVTGWNTLWNQMGPAEQEAYIIRAKGLEEIN